MRVIQTKNDTIRLIFNPKTDGLCLSDFLIVRDGKDNFLAQIVEIYDDKFNQEENVASIKLVYRILPDYQVVPYDNFTPSRECEIAKIKPEEIEKCLNIDKTTVPFGVSTKNNRIVNVNLDFFNNNAVVFADKLDEVNCAFENIAQKLKAHKKVVAIDYTGNLNIKNAKRIKAHDDFKLPLDYYSLDYIWEKALKEATPEAEFELEEMFSELKKFVETTEDKYIPFPRFIKVIEQQYKATPVSELKLLLTRLKRYYNDGLFSRSKKEFQAVSKAVQKENVIIIDFSNLKLEWHKEFLEFVVRQIRDYDSYLLLRLNENNSNPEFINNLYLKNPKISIIPSISYGFVKMPQVMEYARNYILYKTLNPRRDFGFANSQIAALNSSSFLIFGKDTMDFMFTLKNYIYDEEDTNKIEDKKIYIDLNLELEEMTSVELLEGNFDIKNLQIQNNQKRLADEVAIDDILPGYEQNRAEAQNAANTEALLDEDAAKEEAPTTDVEAFEQAEIAETKLSDNETIEEEAEEEVVDVPYTLEEVSVSDDNLSKEENAAIIEEDVQEAVNEETDLNDEQSTNVAELIEASLKNDEEYIKEISSDKENEIPIKEDELDYFVNPEASKEEVITSKMITDAIITENLADEIEAQTKDTQNNDVVLKKNSESDEELVNKEIPEESTQHSKTTEINANDAKIQEAESLNPVASEPEMMKEPVAAEEQIEKQKEENAQKNIEEQKEDDNKETLESIKQEAHEALQEEVLQKEAENNTAVQKEAVLAKKQNPDEAIIIVKEKPNLLIDDFSEEKEEEKEDISLKELAQKSIEARFDEVIKETRKPEINNKNQLKINENITIDINDIKNKDDSTQSALPIFKNNEEEEDVPEYDFVEGMKVTHEKYGAGSIIKVVKYSNRCLLQIEFEQTGKRLLDPKIAKIKPL